MVFRNIPICDQDISRTDVRIKLNIKLAFYMVTDAYESMCENSIAGSVKHFFFV